MKKTYLIIFLLNFSLLNAQWPTTPDSALHVGFGAYPMLTVDPNDESITVVYLIDERIEAKKFDRYGYPMWGGNAVALVDTPGTSWVSTWAYPTGQWGQIISDDSGGAVICWEDYRNAPLHPVTFEPEGSEVFIQRVDVNGQVRYGTNGKKISGTATDGFRWMGDMKTDYHGGFVLSYNYTFSPYYGFLKRFDMNGYEIWERMFSEGFTIDVNATDNFGNIFVSYGGSYGQPNRRMKLDIQGNYLWSDTLDGKIPDDISYKKGGAFSDKMEGAIGVGPGYLKINRVDSTGQFIFGNNGINLGGGQLTTIRYASDEAGGIYVNWTDNYVRVQRISKNGNIVFGSSGVFVCDSGHCVGPRGIVSDGNHGAIAVWGDTRHWPERSFYAQRIDSSGNLLWDSCGVEIHTSSDDLFFTGSVIPLNSDGSGGAILLFIEEPGFTVSLKQISANGVLGQKPSNIKKYFNHETKDIYLYNNYPNPFNSETKIKFKLNKPEDVTLIIYDITGKIIRSVQFDRLNSGVHSYAWNSRDNNGNEIASGIYFYRLITNEYSITKKLLLIQ